MGSLRRIGLVAHDERKKDLLDWVRFNRETLSRHALWATGTTGRILTEACDLEIRLLKSGPLGGDQQLGAMIAGGELDILIFFWDPMTAHPHDVDVKALLRMAVLYNVAIACNRATADYLISSDLFHRDYRPTAGDAEAAMRVTG